MFLYEVTTPSEIEKEYDLPEGSVRRDLARERFRAAEVRKSGSTWLITWREAKRIYKGELTMIKVIDDWTWICTRVDGELENDELSKEVTEWSDKHGIDLDRVKELYHDGLTHGRENGKYLSFSQWFHEYKEIQEETDRLR